ncbi:MAG: DNA-binding transcriptional regulator [Pirellulales bacterium]
MATKLSTSAKRQKTATPASWPSTDRPLEVAPAGKNHNLVRRVALLIETSREYGRGLLRGISRYCSERGTWSVYLQPRGLDSPPPAWLRRWQGDGILARIDNRQMADAVVESGMPAIDLRNAIDGMGLPLVGTDSRAVAEMAARHLLDRGFFHFAYCGYTPGECVGSDNRGDSFQAYLAAHKKPCHFFQPTERRRRRHPTWDEEIEQLADWVRELPKSVGVMAVNDDRGLQVLEACRRIGIVVPEELALVSVDNDEILCNMATPSMSSIALDVEQIGYRAAALLDHMMSSKSPEVQHVRLPPLGVISRKSSDITAVADRDVAQAAQWIRQHACENISVNQVVLQTSLSRRSLEQRFVKLLGRTLNSEIIRVKLDRVQRLLVETSLPLSAIAEQAGISSSSYLSVLFHRKLGLTPAQFRRRHRRF